MFTTAAPRFRVRDLTCTAMCLTAALVLPFLTGQIPQIGSALCPMHLPILLAGFLCGPWWALLAGFTAPFLRNLMFGMPPLITAIAMSFELATYGLISGLLYRRLPHKPIGIYISLFTAMLAGRVVWGIARLLLTGVAGEPFTWPLFLAGAFTTAIPGILVQLILIPILVLALQKTKFLND